MYVPQYKIGSEWYAFQSRGKDVTFATEAEAREYLRGVAGETRIVRISQ